MQWKPMTLSVACLHLARQPFQTQAPVQLGRSLDRFIWSPGCQMTLHRHAYTSQKVSYCAASQSRAQAGHMSLACLSSRQHGCTTDQLKVHTDLEHAVKLVIPVPSLGRMVAEGVGRDLAYSRTTSPQNGSAHNLRPRC